MSEVKVIKARKIITMNSYRPEASHVALRDGRVLSVGGPEIAQAFPDASVDDSFADFVLTPGFVEGHCHVFEGQIWDHAYIGYHERRDPDGVRWPGLTTPDAVIERLRVIERRMPNADAPLFAWGFDPIYFGRNRLERSHLDSVSQPVRLLFSSRTVI